MFVIYVLIINVLKGLYDVEFKIQILSLQFIFNIDHNDFNG